MFTDFSHLPGQHRVGLLPHHRLERGIDGGHQVGRARESSLTLQLRFRHGAELNSMLKRSETWVFEGFLRVFMDFSAIFMAFGDQVGSFHLPSGPIGVRTKHSEPTEEL